MSGMKKRGEGITGDVTDIKKDIINLMPITFKI